MTPLDTRWFRGVDPSKKKDFEQLIRNSTVALNKMLEIISDLEAGSLKDAKSDYDSPSWAYKQADNIGYRRLAKELKRVLSFLE